MADAGDSDISQDYSDLSSEYSYSSNDEAELGLTEATTTKERPAYRIIDADLLKKVQVRCCCCCYCCCSRRHMAALRCKR
jgi:hypothetical protein